MYTIPNALIQKILWDGGNRQFTNKELTKEQIYSILCVAMVSSSGNYASPWEFVVGRDEEKLSN